METGAIEKSEVRRLPASDAPVTISRLIITDSDHARTLTPRGLWRKHLFTHYDDPGKCEWRGGALDAFVKHYNEISGTKYALTECLDVVRISGDPERAGSAFNRYKHKRSNGD